MHDNTDTVCAASPSDRILYIDDDVVVVNKLPGEVCSFVDGEKSDDAPYLPDVFRAAVAKAGGNSDSHGEFLECVHRIDRPVSGCVVMARNKRALAEVSGQFTNHTTASKKYWAVVEGVISASASPAQTEAENNEAAQPNLAQTMPTLLEDYLVFDTKKQKTFIVKPETRKAKKAQLYWRCAGTGERYSFIEVELLTGRTHQIRAQLAHAGLHIKGDVKYGARRADTLPGIRLHAREVSFVTPGKKQLIKVVSPLPSLDPLWTACENCLG